MSEVETETETETETLTLTETPIQNTKSEDSEPIEHQERTSSTNDTSTPPSSPKDKISLIPSENATKIVEWQFGDWIGPVVGDYPCSFGNYSGRLYAGWNAICFYRYVCPMLSFTLIL